MSPPLRPSGDHYRSTTLRITELTVTSDLLEGLTFENCQIIGPAVLALLDGNQIVNCGFEGTLEGIIWEVPESREQVYGAIGVRNCLFSGCQFTRIGLAAPPAVADQVRRALGGDD